MNTKRVYEILKNKEKCDIFYEESPVWIQEVKDDVATIGFLNGPDEKNVYIEDLYEDSLYHDGKNKPEHT